MNMHKAFRIVPETCPTVSGALNVVRKNVNDILYSVDRSTNPDLFSALKDALEHLDEAEKTIKESCTIPLRGALIEALDERDVLEKRVEELEDQILSSTTVNKTPTCAIDTNTVVLW